MSDWKEKLNQLHKEFEGGYAEDKIVELEYALFEFEKEIYNKAIDDVLEKLNKHYDNVAKEQKYPQYDHYCNGVEDCIDIAEQLKAGGINEK